jgi:hypothetical protein
MASFLSTPRLLLRRSSLAAQGSVLEDSQGCMISVQGDVVPYLSCRRERYILAIKRRARVLWLLSSPACITILLLYPTHFLGLKIPSRLSHIERMQVPCFKHMNHLQAGFQQPQAPMHGRSSHPCHVGTTHLNLVT